MKYQQWKYADTSSAHIDALVNQGIAPLVATVLCARGLSDPNSATAFLGAGHDPLHDPLLLRDMDKAVARIHRALAQKESIVVYGDYDVDGITATCLLTHYLRRCGGTVTPYIPVRAEEGYGLNPAAIQRLAEQGATLIVTVDCGITAVEEVKYATSLGVDVVISDHHECKETMPPAVAVVDPHRRDCTYPFHALAGVGVALKLVMALGGPENHERLLSEYADLAAVGTVADVMQLVGENRTIVLAGLSTFGRACRPGFHALIKEAGADKKTLCSTIIGFTLAPRLNAAGRMGCASLACELLLCEDPCHASALALQLCELNRERQRVEGEIFEEAVAQVEKSLSKFQHAIVLAEEGWHQGVVGIVASRLAEKYACPTFMICLQEGMGKGSCRSYGGFNLFNALEHCADLLESFGGHALAAGFVILEENIPKFHQKMSQYVSATAGKEGMVATLRLDGEVSDLSLLNLKNIMALQALEPCGAGNPRPVFSAAGVNVSCLSAVGNGKHLKLQISKGGHSLGGIFFSHTAQELHLSVGDKIDVAFYPQINEFRGNRSPQLQVVDLRPARTRAQVERELYQKFSEGKCISPQEAQSLCPQREDFSRLWRYLNKATSGGRIEDTLSRLAKNVARSFAVRETYMRTMVALDVFAERGLITLSHTTDHLVISLCQTGGKVDLDASPILQELAAKAEEVMC